ncbi:MAG: integration host factor, actinobacterial type [Streptosporangiaceae bacterium]
MAWVTVAVFGLLVLIVLVVVRPRRRSHLPVETRGWDRRQRVLAEPSRTGDRGDPAFANVRLISAPDAVPADPPMRDPDTALPAMNRTAGSPRPHHGHVDRVRGWQRPATADARWSGNSVTPAQTYEQRAVALKKAAETRRARAELLAAIREGRESLPDVLDRSATDDIVGRTRVVQLLRALPGVGRTRADRLMEHVGIAPNRRARGLGSRQRQALREALQATPREASSARSR